MKTYEFTFTGKSPLLFHAHDVEQLDGLQAWRKEAKAAKQSQAGDDRSPPWSWQASLYADGTHLCMPSDNIMSAIRAAGCKVVLSGNTTYMRVTQTGIVILDEFCEFRGVNGKQVAMADLAKFRDKSFADHKHGAEKLGFKLFVKPVRVGMAKHIRVRARFEPGWTVRAQVQVDDGDIKPEVLQRILKIAGDSIGLGDWRPSSPQKPGPYGRFDVALKEVA